MRNLRSVLSRRPWLAFAGIALMVVGFVAGLPRPAGAVVAQKSGTLGAANDTVVLTPGAVGNECAVTITGTWVGTVTFQATVNGTTEGGGTWFSVPAIPPTASTPAPVTTATANGSWVVPGGPYLYVRAKMTAYTSGTANVYMVSGTGPTAVMNYSPVTATVSGTVTANQGTAGASAWPVTPITGQTTVAAGAGATGATTQRVVLATDTTVPNVTGNVASGATDSGNPVKTGGKYVAAGITLTDGQRGDTQLDAAGRSIVTMGTALSSTIDSIWASTEGQKATYSASCVKISAVATPTDIFTLTGSASKTIRVISVRVNMEATAAQGVFVQLIKRSTADTGGTSAAPNIAPHDSNSAAATATPLSYTANPTLGSTVAVVDDGFLTATIAGTATVPNVEFRRTWTANNEQAIVLRGTSQVLAVNLNGYSLIGGEKFSVSITWTEE